MSQSIKEKRVKKYAALESLRGLAALLVTLFHFNFVVSEKLPIIAQGDIFVDFFFVLSGFVVAHAYADRVIAKMSFRDFLLLRIGRLYPLHIFILFIWVPYILGKYVIFSQVGMGSDPSDENNFFSFGLNLLLLQSYGLDDSLSWNGPAWSISVEMGAYLMFFALVAFFRKIPSRFVFPIVSIGCYALLFSLVGDTLLRTYDYGIIRCAGGFFTGAALRMWTVGYNWNPSKTTATIFEILSLSAMLLFVSQIAGSITFEILSFTSFVFVIAIFSLQEKGLISDLLNFRFAVYLGTISYSIYMVHAIFAFASLDFAIYVLKMPTTPESGVKLVTTPYAPLLMIIYLTVIVLLSHFTFNWIEKPFRDRMKNYVKKKKVTELSIT